MNVIRLVGKYKGFGEKRTALFGDAAVYTKLVFAY